MNLMDALNRRFGSSSFSEEKKLACIAVLCDLGLISVGPAIGRQLRDVDPFEEVRCVKSVDEANALLWKRWKLLGSSTSEPFEAWLARPKSIPADDKPPTIAVKTPPKKKDA